MTKQTRTIGDIKTDRKDFFLLYEKIMPILEDLDKMLQMRIKTNFQSTDPRKVKYKKHLLKCIFHSFLISLEMILFDYISGSFGLEVMIRKIDDHFMQYERYVEPEYSTEYHDILKKQRQVIMATLSSFVKGSTC